LYLLDKRIPILLHSVGGTAVQFFETGDRKTLQALFYVSDKPGILASLTLENVDGNSCKGPNKFCQGWIELGVL
jgi:hypothetical protein